jgi:UDP-glucose 6-dehydrogenase
MDRRIERSFLYAGLVLEEDVSRRMLKIKEISGENDVDSDLIKIIWKVNEEQVDYVVEQIGKMGVKKGAKVGMLGLEFKPGTSDVRVSPACRLAKHWQKQI